jgi:4-amino-4-deoxy-L-arabinose transferase-like glycosyltransferase
MWIVRRIAQAEFEVTARIDGAMSAHSDSPSKLAGLLRWMRADDAPKMLARRLFWTGFLVRVLYMTLAHTYRFREFGDHFEFGWEMGRIGRSLATGQGFANPFSGISGPTAWNPPLYPLIVAAAFKVFGIYTLKSSWVILTINSVFSAATAVAIYEIAMRCFSRVPKSDENVPDARSIALWSAWLWALYPAAMQYAVRWVWDMTLTAFLFSCVLVLALRLRGVGDEPGVVASSQVTLRRWLMFGLLWGLIALSNSALLSFLPAAGIWILLPNLRSWSSLRRVLLGPVLAGLVCIAVITPWAVRNYFVFHAFVPLRANFGAELYEATMFSNRGFPLMATLPLSDRSPQFLEYKRMGEVAYSKQQGAIGKAKIRANPGLFAEGTLRRFYFFWISVPHTGDSSFFNEAVRRINFSFFSFTGFFGLALAIRRRVPGAWLFFWAFAVYPILYYFITVEARFRHPLEPIICILSVYLFQAADKSRAFSRW